ESERTEVIEMRRFADAAVAALEGRGLFGLQECEMRARRAALRSAHRRRELVVIRFFGDDQAKTLGLDARVGVLIDLVHRGDDVGSRTYDLRACRRSLAHRGSQMTIRAATRECHREIPGL